ncbi:tigger transposable element-derived protein 1 [Trichonephila clavipes]|nr:tigger transposable element-derived protein 1 [Trichonephila clavipes]
MQLHIPHSKGEGNYPFPLAGVNGPFHSYTYIAKDEKTASGHKASKDRVTLLLCSNASGDRMLKPLLINKSLRPRALKGKDLKQLSVHWMANPKTWMTTAIFTEWFNNCFTRPI